MPFGLRNAAQTFQRFIDQVLQGLECCYAYIDDLLIASPTPEDHKQHLRSVLKCLGILINPAKCVWGATELQFLGHLWIPRASDHWRRRCKLLWTSLSLLHCANFVSSSDSLILTTISSQNVQTYSNHSMFTSPQLPATPKNWPGLRLLSQLSWPSKKLWLQQPSSRT